MAKSCVQEQPMAGSARRLRAARHGRAARLNADRERGVIDINFGCRSRKVVNGHPARR